MNEPTLELSRLDENFTDDDTTRWRRHDFEEGWPNRLEVGEVRDGALEFRPLTSIWWAAFHAPFWFKEVTGDFVVTTRVNIHGLSTAFPERIDSGSLAGLLVRAPASGSAATWRPTDERWLSLTTGLASGPGGRGPSMEVTTTTRGRSGIEWFTSRAQAVDLGIARVGTSVVCTHRFHDGPWAFTRTEGEKLGEYGDMPASSVSVERPDLPETLQVGVTAMTDWPTIMREYAGLSQEAPFAAFNSLALNTGRQELLARFDFVRFARPAASADVRRRHSSTWTADEWRAALP
ncbi:hypothetical protein [Deinococcus yavapaiensis]|uniref:Uncharacterized protein n=1 Tax=Deinococcus yavapaiensis KR-236 TaxID=694435 RepID=A0A318SDR1_9DEIO|nr:hypothetical protein [Deinococcus yavapaiensis]PYE55678.1 hypothetical protein DES52_10241 [Deinococcus yavapaiensis KR-236]